MDDQQERIRNLAREIVLRARPADVAAFDSGADDLLKLSDQALVEQAQGDRPNAGGALSADFGTFVMDMTPIVLYLARQVLDGFVAAATEGARKKAVGVVGRMLGRKQHDAAPTPEPTSEIKITVINVVMGTAASKFRLGDADVAELTGAVRAACGLAPAAAADSA